jgi:excisionase family DNA binding protein
MKQIQAPVKEIEDLPLFFNPSQLAPVWGISKDTAYRLAVKKGFPSARIGKRIIIHREKFIEWADTHFSGI